MKLTQVLTLLAVGALTITVATATNAQTQRAATHGATVTVASGAQVPLMSGATKHVAPTIVYTHSPVTIDNRARAIDPNADIHLEAARPATNAAATATTAVATR